MDRINAIKARSLINRIEKLENAIETLKRINRIKKIKIEAINSMGFELDVLFDDYAVKKSFQDSFNIIIKSLAKKLGETLEQLNKL